MTDYETGSRVFARVEYDQECFLFIMSDDGKSISGVKMTGEEKELGVLINKVDKVKLIQTIHDFVDNKVASLWADMRDDENNTYVYVSFFQGKSPSVIEGLLDLILMLHNPKCEIYQIEIEDDLL